MNLTHLKAFHAVAVHGSFAAAARARGVSQPTLSLQVKMLETVFAVRLFDRVGHKTEITALGARLLEITSKLFAAEEEAAALLNNSASLHDGVLRFGADAPINAIAVLKTFHERHPLVKIALVTGNSDAIREKLLEGRIDVGIIADGTPHRELRHIPVGSQDLVAFSRIDHRLAQAKSVSLTQLVAETLVIREVGSITRKLLEQALSAAGLPMGDVLEVDSREAVQAAVLAGLGVGVAAEDEFLDDPQLTLLDFDSVRIEMTEYLVLRNIQADSPLLQAVLACLKGAA